MPKTGKWFSFLAESAGKWKTRLGKYVPATPICRCCFKDAKSFSFASLSVRGEEPICQKCFQEMRPGEERFEVGGVKALALYPYEGAFRERLYALKGLRDIEMAGVFLAYQAALLGFIYRGYEVVPAPSYKGHDEERGYNHVVEAFRPLGLPIIEALEKKDDVKQAGSSAHKRQEIGKHIGLRENIDLGGKKILFVDDVFTTGATARACLKILSSLGPKSLKALFLARTSGKTPQKGDIEDGNGVFA